MNGADKKTLLGKTGSVGKSGNLQKTVSTSNTPNKQSILTPASLLLKPVNTPTSSSKITTTPSSISKKSNVTSSTTTAAGSKGGDLISTYSEAFSKGEVKSMCIAQNNIWTGGTDGQLAVYNIQSFENLYKTTSPKLDTISSICYVFDGINDKIWCGYKSGYIAIWNTSTISKEFEFQAHKKCINYVTQVGGFVWSVSDDCSIRIWDMQSLQPVRKIEDHTASVNCIILIASHQQILTAGGEGIIFFRDLLGNVLFKIDTKQPITVLTYCNHKIWSSHSDGSSKVWDLESKEMVKEFKSHTSKIETAIATSKQVWTVSIDKIQIYDSIGIKTLKNIKAKKGSTFILAMEVLSQERIVTACSDRKLRIWTTEGDRIIESIKVQQVTVAYNPITSEDIRLLDLNNTDLLSPIKLENPDFNKLIESPAIHDLLGAKTKELLMEPLPSITEPEKLPTVTTTEAKPSEEVITQLSEKASAQSIVPEQKNIGSPGINTADLTKEYSSDEEVNDKHEYEKEIVALRQQLQETTARISKYKQRLTDKKLKLEERDIQIKGYIHDKKASEREVVRLKKENYNLAQKLHAYTSKVSFIRNVNTSVSLKIKALASELNEGQKLTTVISELDNTQIEIAQLPDLESDISKSKKEEVTIAGVFSQASKLPPEKVALLGRELELAKKDIKIMLDDMRMLQKENQEMKEDLEERDVEVASLKHIVTDLSSINSSGDISQDKLKLESLTQAVMDYGVELAKVEKKLELVEFECHRFEQENKKSRIELNLIVDHIVNLCTYFEIDPGNTPIDAVKALDLLRSIQKVVYEGRKRQESIKDENVTALITNLKNLFANSSNQKNSTSTPKLVERL